MKFLTITLGLATTASAIDLRLFPGRDCVGTYFACGNINPDTCCSDGNANFVSLAAAAIPSDWRISVRAHSNGACNSLRSLSNSGGSTDVCISENDGFARISGAGYGFGARKRDTGAATNSTNECVKPDIFGWEGETTAYALSEMEEPLLNALMEYAKNGTDIADIPQVFEPYKIET